MRLSIIIPLYNKENYIERCLKSLVNQDISSNAYEIIIIDDGSIDSGITVVQNYAEQYSNIVFFSQENKGVSAARNKGLELSTGDYVYFLDADDYLASNVIEGIIELSEKNNLDILEFSSKEVKAGEVTETTSQISKTITVDVTDGLSYIVDHNFRTQAWRYIVKRDFLIDNDIKFMEGIFYEDVLFTASAFVKAKRMSKLNLDVHRYVEVPNSIVTNKSLLHQQKMSNSIVIIVDKISSLINSLDSSNLNFEKVVKRLKARQQAMVFSLLLRTIRHCLFNINDLNKILNNFRNLDVYPMNPKIGGGMQNGKSRLVLPIFNNKPLLFLALRLRRFVPSNYSF